MTTDQNQRFLSLSSKGRNVVVPVTKEQMKIYRHLYEQRHFAKDRYNALLSQGKYCPPDILEDAKFQATMASLEYEAYKLKMWPPESLGQFIMRMMPRLLFAGLCLYVAALVIFEL